MCLSSFLLVGIRDFLQCQHGSGRGDRGLLPQQRVPARAAQ